jgi:glutaminyl-tRNA synthetase
MIKNGKFYVDSQSSDDMAIQKLSPTQPGVDGPLEIALCKRICELFEAMKSGVLS